MRKAEPATAPTFTGADVAKLRQRLGLSQSAFAARLGVARYTVILWEKGRNPPSQLAVAALTLLAEVGLTPREVQA